MWHSLTDAEYAARNQRGDIIGEKEGEGIRCWYTRQNVESVAQQNAHCLLELGLSCLSALIRVGIYPIILHIPLTEKSSKKLKKTRQWWGKCEDLLLECAQREEAELDALPCLYRTVDPDSWNDAESLLCRVKSAITDEQKRIVWLENQPCWIFISGTFNTFRIAHYKLEEQLFTWNEFISQYFCSKNIAYFKGDVCNPYDAAAVPPCSKTEAWLITWPLIGQSLLPAVVSECKLQGFPSPLPAPPGLAGVLGGGGCWSGWLWHSTHK